MTHFTQGRSEEANKRLQQWTASMEDKPLIGRVLHAFAGRICQDDKALLRELTRMTQIAATELRVEAVRVLSMHGGKDAMGTVHTCLGDTSPSVRRQALVGIDYACDRNALDDVEQLIRTEESEDVVTYARSVLARLKGDLPCAAIPGLDAGS